MADNVPVCDVLVEAMEYLAKLGSNLRTRSETLKEKRIRRDKLKNAHAVQKAAKKVLLICELSKKSLENVEVGVNKVLRLVDKSQAAISVGGNSDRGSPGDKTKTSKADDRPSTSEKKDYQYVRYRSSKLKISKKVPVKHYMSVNVFAKELPKSIQDKYPVYYDCKLYRMRKRKALKEQERIEILESIEKSKDDLALDAVKEKSRKNSEEQIDSEAIGDNKSSPKNCGVVTEKRKLSLETNSEVHTKDDEMRVSSVENKERCNSESNNQINKERKKSSEKSEDDARTIERQIECKKSLLEDSESEKDIQDMDESKEKTKERKPKTISDFKENKTHSKKNDSSPDRSKSDSKKSKDASCARKERKKITVIKSDSEDETKKGNECSTKKSDTKTFGEDENNTRTEEREKIHSSKRKKRILSTDSESSQMESDKESKVITNELSEEKPKRVDSDKEELQTYSEKEYKSKQKESNNCSREKKEDSNFEDCTSVKNKGDIEIDKDVIELASDDEHSGPDKADQTEKQKENKVSNKPLIKCVSLTKLLKPDILPIVMPACAIKNQDKKNATKDRQTERTKKTVRYQDEEEFWSQKRVEVKAFKPKEFSIKITRLPLVNVDVFLQTHKIKRIIQGGKVIHEIRTENKQSKTNSTGLDDSQDKNKKKFIQCCDISKVKNALLNDSDSDEEVNNENEKNSVTDISSEKESTKKNKNELDNRSDNDDTGPNEKELENKSDSNTQLLERDISTKDSGKELENKSFKNDDKKKKVNELENKSFKNDDKNKNVNESENYSDNAQRHENKQSTTNSTGLDDSQDKNEDNFVQCPDISKVKNALLNDSDSEEEVSRENKKNSVPDIISSEKESTKKNNESDKRSDDDTGSNEKELENKSDGNTELLERVASTKYSEKESENKSFKNDDKKKNVNESENNSNNMQSNNNVDGCSELSNKNDNNFSQMLSEQENNLVDEDQENVHKPPGEEITPPQEDDPETVKSALLNSSSNSTPTSPSSSKHKKSKRKHIMESIKAKKMLLIYSSSSEDEFEKVKKGCREIKKALLQCGSSDDEMSKNDKASEDKKSSDFESDSKKKRSREQLSSDSEENVIRKVKRKKRKILKTRRPSKNNSRSPSPAKKDEENGKSGEEGEDKVSKASTIDQVDGTMDEQSNSSNSKMGRSNEKAGSSQNSDAPDDKDIDGLTNLSSLNKSRRRRDSDAAGDSISKRTRKSKISKATPLIQGEEGLLEAAMTDDESGEESEGGVEEEEDLPPVSLSGLNGAAIGELAKDELLGESDSSCSNEKDQQSEDNVKKEESSSEDQVKLKRRKNAISSDSEAGSSRRKRNVQDDARVSDFEDSETESSEPIKKTKKKKKVDSDESAGSSNEAGKKKRKRIKLLDDSEASGSDSDNEGRNKHGRKNIRKVMGKSQLEEATKKAARQEKERIARIAERQKLYNNLEFDESGKPDEVVLDKVVLDFDPETKEPLIEVDRGLVKKLKPHQANGIKFMWDACFESVKRIKKDKGSGCILAHCMGLGKTLQVVSLTHTLLIHSELTKVERVLVVCPLSTVLNWVNEFHMWLKHAENDYEVDIYELSKYKQNSERAFQLSQWYTHGGVCVLGYEMFRNLSADNAKKYKKKMLKSFQEALVDPGPDMVVCDEGHLLKNEKTSLSQSMNRVRTLRRIVLTGTPLQNNLKEYYCMVQFVKPNLLGKYNEYLNRFVNPITNGQYTDSTEHDIRVMKRRSHVLHKMLDGAVQRRDYGVLAPFLPPKHEYVLFITLSEIQVKLYQHYLENYSRRPLPGKSSGFLFPDFQSLQRIWTHPLVLKYNSERYELMQQKKRDKEEEDSEGSLVDFIDDDSTPEDSSTEESSDDLSDLSDDSRKKSKKKKEKKKAKETAANRRRGTRANPVEHMEVEEVKDLDQIEGRNDNPTEWWIPLVTDEELDDVRKSHKLQLLLEILRQCEAIGDKLLVFSQSLYSLDLIEHFLGKIDEATQEGRVDEKLGGHVGSWAPGVDYFRLDGSTSCENRSIWCKNFNREDNPRARLFLISTRAGGLGINLVAANRVVIFDVSWNPSHDVQSIFRVYRFGQKKPCYIYRFLAMGTMEEKIYERQVTKQAISKRVIDEQQIDRHYAENDLAELYKFEPTPPTPRPVPLVPKDRLFAEMLKQHENCIYKFHEHDSLLENKEEETLTEEERKAAWDDFENEKNRPPPVPFANTWPPHNGMAGLLAQQQQQLAFAALASMLRKDMPGLTEEQIRGMLPLIYSSNPGLMQKLNDIYKYPQPSMMNPAAMMNPIMNPVGGGTSGMQYEPPWAREQQQQQQLRLQQLMQHQNMGAKYYAGGLGSRDPVAMALQQQRAREIMLGERGGAVAAAAAGGRPRGRPPLQPRAPAPGDVVNLDSD